MSGEPQSPTSSPVSHTKITDRLGRGARSIASATASIPALPEALSSAAL